MSLMKLSYAADANEHKIEIIVHKIASDLRNTSNT